MKCNETHNKKKKEWIGKNAYSQKEKIAFFPLETVI